MYATKSNGGPALAFARLSHPTLLAPFGCVPTGRWVCAAPSQVVLTFGDKSMKRRPFPVGDPLCEPVISWIPVTVVGAAFQIVLITNRVFPVTFLPDAALSLAIARCRLRPFVATSAKPSFGEFFLDPHPAKRISIVTGRTRPDCVQMIRKQYDCDDLKRMMIFDLMN